MQPNMPSVLKNKATMMSYPFFPSPFLLLFLLLSVVCTNVHAAIPLPPESELTLRTTSSVDMQVCASNLLSTDRDPVEAIVIASLRYALGRTTAVYLVRESTTSTGGTVCWTFVYQAPNPDAAARARQSIANAQPSGTPRDTLSVAYGGMVLLCPLTVVPWQGESAPIVLLPDLSAQDIVFYGGAAGGIMGVCMVATCCFIALSYSQDERRAQNVLRADRRAIRQFIIAAAEASSTPRDGRPPSHAG